MSRFSVAALAGAFATFCVASHATKIGDTHKINSDALLRNARPYRKGVKAASSRRRLGGDDDFQIDASYSIKFSQCVDVKLLDQDLFGEEVIEYTQSGQITSAQSYALFRLCQGYNCYYESEEDLYIVDLATYVMNVASYLSTVQSSYCASCNTYYNDYCVAQADDAYQQGDDAAAADDDQGDDAAADDDAANYYEGDDDYVERKLRKQRRTTSYIDCDQCEAYGCLNDNDDDQQQDDEDNGALELVEDISQCLNTGLNWNDDNLYVGFMCSPYNGDGVELAIFLDNQCTVYTSLKAFSDIPSWYIYNDDDLFAEAETFIKSAFTETIPCLYEEFGDPSYQNNGDDDAAANNGDDGYEVNDYCAAIFDEEPVALNSCVQNDDQNNNNQNNGNDDDQYNWYEYDMNYDDSMDLDEVCLVVQQKEGEYSYHYDEGNSGTWNDHSGRWGDSSKNNSKGRWGFVNGGVDAKYGFATSPVMISLYAILGVAMIVGLIFVVGVNEKRKRAKMEPVYQGGRLV